MKRSRYEKKETPVVPIASSQSFKRTSKTGVVLSKQMVSDATSLQTPAKKRTEEKLDKEIKIILVISGHGYCETIKCKENICEIINEESACIFDKDKSILHDCGDATSNFHMSVYTEDIKLYSYAHYGYKTWNMRLKLFTDSKGKDLYYNDFSRIYDVNRQIEATVTTKRTRDKLAAVPEGPDYNDYNMLMTVVSRDINDQNYQKRNEMVYQEIPLTHYFSQFSVKSIVKEVYIFEDDYRSDDPLFTHLKKLIEEPGWTGWTSWGWSVLGYDTYPEAHTIAPNVIFSGIFVAKTNKPENFGKEGQKLLPNEINPNYNCDFTLFSHIYEIGGTPLCNLILNYIVYWNIYINNNEFKLCEKRINGIKLKYNKENIVLSKITYINNESLYHIVNIILNFNIPGSELIKTLSESFSKFKLNRNSLNIDQFSDNYTSKFKPEFKVLLDDICGLFNVELHLISNACRSLLNSVMSEPGMEGKIRKLQNSISKRSSSMKTSVGGKKTRKRKHRRTKKRRLHKKYI